MLSIIIPVRDETLNLKVILRVLHAVIDVPFEIIVVTDTFEDLSLPIIMDAKAEFLNISHTLNDTAPGVVHAVQRGIEDAKYETILIYAADELSPSIAINDMFELIQEGCEFVSCTRYRHGGRRLGGSKIGHFLSWSSNLLFFALTSNAFSDCTTGIKMFKKSHTSVLLDLNALVGWSFAFRMSIIAQTLNLSLGEVPIISVDRLFGGGSSMRLMAWVCAYFKFLMFGFKKLPPAPFGSRRRVKVRIPENI